MIAAQHDPPRDPGADCCTGTVNHQTAGCVHDRTVDLGGKYSTLVLTIGASPAGGPGSEAVLIDVRSDNGSTPYFGDKVLERNAPPHMGPFTVQGVQTLKITVSERHYDEAVIDRT